MWTVRRPVHYDSIEEVTVSFKIELDEQTAAVVQELAANEKRSASEVIHDAVAVYACKPKRKLPTGVGKYSSGQPNLAQRDEEILRKAAKEGQLH
jgi:hypothetical protein